MKKSVFLLCVLVISFGVGLSVEYNKKSNYNLAPNVMIDDTVYWFSRSYSDPSLIERFDFVGVVEKNEDGIATTNFSASGVAVDAKIFRSADYPGWLYIKWGQHINRFTVWELSYPLIRYNGSIYVAANEFQNSMAGNEIARIRVKNYSDEYEVVGTLTSGEVDAVPTSNFEANSEVYWEQKLYCDPNDTSTIYADAQYAGNSWREPFYKASLIPIIYEPYIKTGGNYNG
jgi:hypothetical protein